jgi:hypothetical protein
MPRKKKKAKKKKVEPEPKKLAGRAPASSPPFTPPETIHETISRLSAERRSCEDRSARQQQEELEAGADSEDTITLSELLEDMDL